MINSLIFSNHENRLAQARHDKASRRPTSGGGILIMQGLWGSTPHKIAGQKSDLPAHNDDEPETFSPDCGDPSCDDAHPPVSPSCFERLTGAGVSPDEFEFTGHLRIRTRKNGECVLSKNGECRIHAFKPETCRAGPFTFDIKGDLIGIYLRHESICPIARLLKEDPGVYRQQYELAVQGITHLFQYLTDDEISVICRIDEPETKKSGRCEKIKKEFFTIS